MRAPTFITIDGRSGSGKTELAQSLARLLAQQHQVSVLHLDEIYPGWDQLAAGVAEYRRIAKDLELTGEASWRLWDWENSAPGVQHTVNANEIIICEGVGATRASAPEDFAISLSASADFRRERALTRDGEAFRPYWQMWADQEEEFARKQPAHTPQLHIDVEQYDGDMATLVGYVYGLCSGNDSLMQQCVPEVYPAYKADYFHSSVELPVPDPAALVRSLAGTGDVMWLDSSSTHTSDARSKQSVLALRKDGPGAELFRSHAEVTGKGFTYQVPLTPFDWLQAHWPFPAIQRAQPTVSADSPSFSLGWVGQFSYESFSDAAAGPHHQEPTSAAAQHEPVARMFLAQNAVVLDHEHGTVSTLSAQDPHWENEVHRGIHAGLEQGTAPWTAPQFQWGDSAESYQGKVRAAQDYIYEGESYEVCLTTELRAPAPEEPVDWLGVYQRLRERNASAFGAYFQLGDLRLLSTSPERFLSVSPGGHIWAEPIKGTRARAAGGAGSAKDDAQVIAELLGSVKERAENLMIVDLLRNDLSRHAIPGTVRTERLFAIESYPSVHHMVSTITAQLDPQASRAQLLADAFPPGSMTGAPKARTMEILTELEARTRGPYSGFLGYCALNGAADLSVVIRTLVVSGSELSLAAGGAITSDSSPEEEWAEVQTKLAGVLRVLEGGKQ